MRITLLVDHVVGLVYVVDNGAVTGVGRTATGADCGSQRQLTWLRAQAARGRLLVLPNLVRLVAHQRAIVRFVQCRVALRVIDNCLGHMRRRQLCIVLARVECFVVLIAAAQCIVVAARPIDGAGGATGTSRWYFIGVGAHSGGHLGARCGQYAVAQRNVLQLLVNVHTVGHRLRTVHAWHQLHIVVERAIALVDFGLTRVVTTWRVGCEGSKSPLSFNLMAIEIYYI